MPKTQVFLSIIFFLVVNNCFSQSFKCIDISNRIKYSFPTNGGIVVKAVNSLDGFLVGNVSGIARGDTGAIIAKTYLDKIVWSKRYKGSVHNFTMATPNLLPDSSVIFNNATYAGNHFYLVRISKSGIVLWAKEFYIPGNLSIGSNNQTSNSILINKNSIFLTTNASFTNYTYNVAACLDYNGNIKWSKSFLAPYALFNDPPSINNDTLLITGNIYHYGGGYFLDSIAGLICKMNILDGSIFSNQKIKIVPDNLVQGINIINSKLYPDNTLLITGNPAVYYNPVFPQNGIGISGFTFFLKIKDNQLKARYFTYPQYTSNAVPDFLSGFSSDKKSALFLRNTYVPTRIGYTILLDSNLKVFRERVCKPQSSNSFLEGSFGIDDNNTVYYSFPHNPNKSQTDLEYSRVSINSPANGLDCFGVDTSIVVPHDFNVVTDTFSWDAEYNNLLQSRDFTVTSEPFTINEEVICTETSICDTIKILGTTNHCLSEPSATFTLFKNPKCYRITNWTVDTTAIKILKSTSDSLELQFLKSYKGFIHAQFEGCELRDSFYVDVKTPGHKIDLENDRVLCAGQTIDLNAGNGFSEYRWQDGSKDSTYSVNKEGTYFVIATDSCGNIFSDTIHVLKSIAKMDFSYPGIICNEDTATIKLDTQLKNYSFVPYESALISKDEIKFFPDKSTLYTIKAEALDKCIVSDTILINVKDCPLTFFIPNSFTPNNDGLNDVFRPVITGRLVQYEFSIFNRYGQRIFKSNKSSEGWSGFVSGTPQPIGVYVWICHYQFKNKENQTRKGSVYLVR